MRESEGKGNPKILRNIKEKQGGSYDLVFQILLSFEERYKKKGKKVHDCAVHGVRSVDENVLRILFYFLFCESDVRGCVRFLRKKRIRYCKIQRVRGSRLNLYKLCGLLLTKFCTLNL